MNDTTTYTVRSRMPKYGRIPKDLLRDPTMSATAVRVYGLLDDVNGHETVTHEKIAQWTGTSVRTASRAVYELRDAGWVEVHERFSGERQTANEYTLTLGVLPDLSGGSLVTTRVVTSDTTDHEMTDMSQFEGVVTSDLARVVTSDQAKTETRDEVLVVEECVGTTTEWCPEKSTSDFVAEKCPLINVDLSLAKFIAHCESKGRTPTAAGWRAWALEDQARATAAVQPVGRPKKHPHGSLTEHPEGVFGDGLPPWQELRDMYIAEAAAEKEAARQLRDNAS